MSLPPTFYPIERSPLFRVSPKKLAALLNFSSAKSLREFVDSCSEHYAFFLTSKGRAVQQPLRKLDAVQKRLAALLCRIEVPAYLHSGIKGKSYRDNATIHFENGRKNMFTMDIKSFFPSTSYKHVWKCFVSRFRCDQDVASLLTKLTTVNGHLPTGSSISTILSFHAYKPMFDRIERLSVNQGVLFSCYVDDLTFSGNRATRTLANRVRRIINLYGLPPHPSKTRFYSADAVKIVTGVALTPQGMRLPNSRRKRIHDNFIELASCPNHEREKLESSLRGRLGEASLFEPRFKSIRKKFSGKNRRIAGVRRRGE